MLANMKSEPRRTSWWMRTVLLAGGLTVVALPAVYLSRPELAAAQLPTAAPVEKESAEPTPAPAAEPAKGNQLVAPTFLPTTARPTQVAEPSVEYYPEPSESEQRLVTALETKGSFEFTETPLIDVMVAIKTALDDEIEVQLDNRALEDAGVSSATPITRRVKSVPIRAALELILGELDLTYLVKNSILLITTQDEAETELVTRTYPVGDLLADVPTRQGKTGSAPAANRRIGGAGSGMFTVPDEVTPRVAQLPSQPTPQRPTAASNAEMTKDYDTLIEAITTTVKPQTWDEVGGPGSIVPVPVSSSLVISQTRDVHDEILELLRSLRAAKRASHESEK